LQAWKTTIDLSFETTLRRDLDVLKYLAFSRNSISIIVEEALGGHSMARHAHSLTLFEMEQRVLGTHPTIRQARSSMKFLTQELHETTVQQAFDFYKDDIAAFHSYGNEYNTWPAFEFEYVVGDGYHNYGTLRNPNIAYVQTKKVIIATETSTSHPDGFIIDSAYPKFTPPAGYNPSSLLQRLQNAGCSPSVIAEVENILIGQRLIDFVEEMEASVALSSSMTAPMVRAWEVARGSSFAADAPTLMRLSDDFTSLEGFESFLRSNPDKVNEWFEFDLFFINLDGTYWAQFNNPPSVLAQTRTWSLTAMVELPDSYVNAVADFSHINGKPDVYTRYGVDYKSTFYQIINNYKTNNPYGMFDVDIHTTFGYTSNFFYKKLNSYLWQEINLEQTTNITNLINEAMNKLPTFDQELIYRGIEVGDSGLASFLASHALDKEVTWKGYSSCGNSEAASFSGRTNIMFIIKHSEGKDISDLADGIHFRGKPPYELLIKNNSKMKVSRTPYLHPDNPTKWVIEVTQIE
jgi:hypothetical protein